MKQTKKMKQKNGFSLIELLLVLGIIAALAITAFMIYPKVSSSNNAQREASNINTIRASVSSLYSSSPDYHGLTTAVGIKSKIFPDTMVNTAGTAALNTFKGNVTLATSSFSRSGFVRDSAFSIIYEAVPSAECVKIVSAVQSNFYSILVGKTAVKDNRGSGTTVAVGEVAVDVAKLTTACAAGNITIQFISQ